MRSLKEQVGTDYEDRITFYIVGTNPFESVDELEAYRVEHGFPWPVAHPDEGMLAALGITRQASKVAIGGGWTITHHYGTGRGDYDSWSALFDEISVN